MSKDFEELKQRLIKLSDEELIDMVQAAPGEYRPDALEIAKAELKWRRVEIPEPEEAEPETEPTSSNVSAGQFPVARPSVPGAGCPFCGGELRTGTLVAEKELTVVFSDNQEERFVKVSACTQCGQISLTADFETEVQG